MDISIAKELVIKAGVELVRSGLIARTWGNVSCRIDDSRFVVTPSGRSYASLTPDEIVTVNIVDCSYIGDIKPSSEKGIHAEVYKLYPAINFVIHTHQENASVIGASCLDLVNINNGAPCTGDKIICAAYALPGTKKLQSNVIDALSRSSGKAVIMKNHGALCLGRNYEEAFMAASELEKACDDFIINQYLKLSGKNNFDRTEMNSFSLSLNHYSENKTHTSVIKDYPYGRRTKLGFMLYYDDGRKFEVKHSKIDASLCSEARIYNVIFKKHKDINHIIFKSTPEITAISCYGIELKPILDDFAQIAGTVAKNIDYDPEKIVKALIRSSVVFLRCGGALCCGKTKEDAFAVGMVTQKACKAYIGASLFGKVNPINALECLFMRYNYLKKYSKQAEIKP